MEEEKSFHDGMEILFMQEQKKLPREKRNKHTQKKKKQKENKSWKQEGGWLRAWETAPQNRTHSSDVFSSNPDIEESLKKRRIQLSQISFFVLSFQI